MIQRSELRLMRNQIDVAVLIHRKLNVHSKISEGRFCFLCPLCQEMHTATNPKTNLARCFRCKRNFNVIDMTMIVLGLNFLDAIELLQPLIDHKEYQRRMEHGPDLIPPRKD